MFEQSVLCKLMHGLTVEVTAAVVRDVYSCSQIADPPSFFLSLLLTGAKLESAVAGEGKADRAVG